MNKGKKCLVIGDVFLDHYIYGNIQRLNPECHYSPLVKMNGHGVSAGGAANVAQNISCQGVQTHLVVAYNGMDWQSLCPDLNVHIVETQRDNVIVKQRVIVGGHQICRVDSQHCIPLQPFMLIQKLTYLLEYLNPSYVILSDYAKQVFNSCIATVVSRIKAHDPTIQVILDPKQRGFSKIGALDAVFPNAKEFACEFGQNGIFSSALYLAGGYTFKTVGPRGVQGYHCDKPFDCPSPRVTEVDPTGAGDIITAKYAVHRLFGCSQQQSIQQAVVAAAYSVTQTGTGIIQQAEAQNALFHN